MTSANGFNPMRYDCETSGCFNKKRRPKIEVFADCFPGKISFGDVDAEVEINGYSLRLEWKSYAGDLPKGQTIMFSNKTHYGIDTVICVCGDAETMDITHYGMFFRGKWHNWHPATLDELKAKIDGWAQWANTQPPTKTIAGIMRCVLNQFKIRDVRNYIDAHIARKIAEIERREADIAKREAALTQQERAA